MSFDITSYRLSVTLAPQAPRAAPVRVCEPFIKGPLPLEWIRRAMRLRSGAIKVGLALWYFAGLKRSPRFSVSNAQLRKICCTSEDSVRRGLADLAGSGLIHIERPVGQKAIVTLCSTATRADLTKEDEHV